MTSQLSLPSIIALNAKARKPSELTHVKFTRKTTTNGVEDYTQVYLPKLPDDCNSLETFDFLKKFENGRRDLQWTTGPKLFSNMLTLLSECTDAEDTWEDLTAQSATETVATFTVAFTGFKSAMLSELRHDDQLEYLRTISKPDTMTVRAFLQRLKTLNSLAKRFPDAPATNSGLTDMELKRCFHHGMPKKWRDNFTVAGRVYSSETLNAIYIYMTTQEAAAPVKKPSPKTPSTSNDSGDNQAPRSNTTPGGRIQPNDPCPLPGHGNHIWYLCRQNHFGKHHADTHRPQTQASTSTPPGTSTVSTPDTASSSSSATGAEQHFIDYDGDADFSSMWAEADEP
eukprot:CAMPEP_0113605192 /NCGR_PEP_ID=MMETSP0017_2-20120614/2194_1 /TAXON_ID=2856 /ORGANISM="Cylindrotheca closterium" /LENGTH=340 /DNA_ID=CAMNT_0000513661 /DNA_START=48 /DNA_END=1070 /DNA_ORIENTATION=- /assembly_acc=CAM_ASM_000147